LEHGKVVADVPAKALAEEGPRYDRPSAPPAYQDMLQALNYDAVPDVKDANAALLALLGSPTIASKRWVYEQYDHMVRTNTLVRPGSDAAVVRIKGTNKALALSVDCNARYCLLNPYEGAKIAIAECARNLACSGAEPIGVTDCLNFGNPQRPDVMWQFVLAIEGLKDACEAMNVPIVSGNVSFYNETNDLSIYPTPMVGMVGLIEPAERAVTQWFKQQGDAIILLGNTREDLGGTEYLKVLHHREQGSPPLLSFELERSVQACTIRLIRDGLVESAHDCAEGGLAVALAECCMSGPNEAVGAVVQLSVGGLRRDAVLFGESQSRIVLSVRPERLDRVMTLLRDAAVPAAMIGTVGGNRLAIRLEGNSPVSGGAIDLDLKTLHERWGQAIPRALGQH
jgi:phosphoribosylformylglycinamidine synthase II